MELLNSIRDRFNSVWKILKPKLDLVFFHLISASWFPQIKKTKKVIKIEVFYAWMSVAGFLGAYGVGRDQVNDVDFSTQYYWFVSMFILGWCLKVGTAFGYKASKKVREHFWRTQLMRFMDPNYFMQFKKYYNSSDRLRILKTMWYSRYDVTVDWTRDNAPYWQKIQIVLLLGLTGLGLFLGLHL